MLNIIELFSGIGSQAQALKNIGIEHKVVATSEIDKYASKSYEALHGPTNNLGDITKIEELPKADLWTYSFPCFVGDTLVMTYNGYKPIRDISVGNMVLTHKNRYKPVLKTMNQGEKKIVKISAMGIDEIKCTPNHRFYVRTKYRKYLHNPNRNLRLFKEPEWKEAKDLTRNDYLGIAINQKDVLPIWEGIDFEWKDGRSTRHKNELQAQMYNPDFWWVIGRYMGDGWHRKQGGIIICCAKDELDEILPKLDTLPFKYSVIEERTVYKIHLPQKEIAKFVEQFGRGASNKKLTSTIFNLHKYFLRAFVMGYMTADGAKVGNVFKSTSVSRELIYGIGHCIAKAFDRPYSIYKSERSPKHIIEGREVNQKPTYSLNCKLWNSKQDNAFYENGYIWFPLHKIEDCGKEVVYDISVADDESFTANGVIVHNCTDISVAGKLAGLAKDSGTRSGLLWEVERLLLRAKEKKILPTYLLLENVKNLIGKRFKADFDSWLLFLEELGYTNYYKVLNAKHYGIPQNRERVFCVSILGEHKPYQFPEPFPLKLRLRDMLEEKVDEKFYISTQRALAMLQSHYAQRRNSIIKDSGITPTICARDWKEPKCVVLGSLNDKKYSKMHENSRRVHDIDGISPTIHTCAGGNTEPKVAVEERFFRQALETAVENDCEPGDIVDAYNKKVNKTGISPTVTTRPEGFKTAILPVVEEPKIIYEEPLDRKGWHRKAKEVISPNGICTCITGQSNNLLQKITEPMVYDEQNKTLRTDGVANTIMCDGSSPKYNPRVVEIEPRIIQRVGDRDKEKYSTSSCAYTITANPMSDRGQMVIACAMRGRNPDNPSDRSKGSPTEQRLEFNEQGTTNTITTVQKDNLIVCEERTDEGVRFFNGNVCGTLRTIDACGDKRVMEVGGLYTQDSERFHRPPLEEISRTLKAGLHDAGVQIEDNSTIRIRKLTPTECLRLMGWTDEQIAKIKESGISNTQQYKQAGNGIVVQVLERIFEKMLKGQQD